MRLTRTRRVGDNFHGGKGSEEAEDPIRKNTENKFCGYFYSIDQYFYFVSEHNLIYMNILIFDFIF
jgi:hypothetical protein